MRAGFVVLLAATGLVVGCGGETRPEEDAKAAAKQFWGYVAEQDTANYCASLTDGSLVALYDRNDPFNALTACIKNPFTLDDELAARASLIIDEKPASVTVEGSHATIDYGGEPGGLRLFFKDDRGWLVELHP